MKTNKILIGLFCIFFLSFVSCNKGDDPVPGETEIPGGSTDPDTSEVPEDPGDTGDSDLVPDSQDVTFDNAVRIAFSGDQVTIDNPFSEAGVSVTHDGGHVVIRSAVTDKELNYILSGITTNGSVKIYGEYKFGLVLNGVGITNPNGAAINNQCGKKVTVTVVGQTNNRLIDGETYVYTDNEDMKGTFFSEGQLNFYGNGLLEVRGKNKHAICVDDYFRVYEGNIVIKEAASDAVHANDYIRIDGGIVTTRSAGEGFDCEKGYVLVNGGTVNITTTGQKGQGIKSNTYLTVNTTGTIDVTVYGAASKGFSSGGDMTIAQGTITLMTAGDAYYDSEEADISSCAGMKCKGNLLIENGNITILSSGKGGKGISADGTLVINDGSVKVTTTGDQYVYNKNFDTAAKAIKSDGDLTVNGGTIVIRTSKTEAEGLESKSTLTINNGNLDIVAYDDCINASDHIQINGGQVYCYSMTNDGIDSNGTLTITGGLVVSAGSTAPEEGFDCDQNRFTITGGTAIGIGGATSTPTASACTQRSLVYGTSSSLSVIRIESTSSKEEILTFKLPRTYSSTTLLFTSPLLAANTGYTVYTGGSISGGSDFHGLYTGAAYSDGSPASTFTTSSMVTTVGTSGGGGRPR